MVAAFPISPKCLQEKILGSGKERDSSSGIIISLAILNKIMGFFFVWAVVGVCGTVQ